MKTNMENTQLREPNTESAVPQTATWEQMRQTIYRRARVMTEHGWDHKKLDVLVVMIAQQEKRQQRNLPPMAALDAMQLAIATVIRHDAEQAAAALAVEAHGYATTTEG